MSKTTTYKAWAVVSAPRPVKVRESDAPVMHAITFDQNEATAEVSRLRAGVYLELGKMGSIPEETEQALLAYRASIRAEPVKFEGNF